MNVSSSIYTCSFFHQIQTHDIIYLHAETNGHCDHKIKYEMNEEKKVRKKGVFSVISFRSQVDCNIKCAPFSNNQPETLGIYNTYNHIITSITHTHTAPYVFVHYSL